VEIAALCVCVLFVQVLNEILDLRGSGMLDSAGLAYGALEGIERKVLPGWKEHGKTILSDRGLGEDALRMMGMKVPEMERLYQLIYAFSFGFAEMMRDTTFQRRHEDQGKLLLSVLDVHSTLLSEALDMTHHDLLGEMYAAKDREIADLRRDKMNLERRMQSVESEIAWAHEQARIAQERLEAAIKKAEAEVAEANKRARDAERGRFEAEKAQAAAEALRDQALKEATTLRARVAALEAENSRLLFGWEKEKKERAEENAASAKAAAEAAASIAQLRHRLEEYSRENNKLTAQVRDLTSKLEAETVARKAAEQSAAEWHSMYDQECERARQEAAQLRAELHLLNARLTLLEKEMVERLAAKDAEIAALLEQLRQLHAQLDQETRLRRAAEEALAKVEAELQLVCATLAAVRAQLRAMTEDRDRLQKLCDELMRRVAELEASDSQKSAIS
jgi:chromosome segregation ATPase